MFIIKSDYYLYIENTKNLCSFRKKCNEKGFKLYISNDIKLLRDCKADGLYLSSYNKKIYLNKRCRKTHNTKYCDHPYRR